jgi:outer membrane protein assembly factor BamB
MKSRFVVFTVLAAALLLSTGADCRHEIPPRIPIGPYGPDSTWTGVPTAYKVVATISRGGIRYVMDWGDTIDTTAASYASGETATVTHTWSASGTVSIKVQAINAAFPEKASDWSPAKSVRVIADDRPVLDRFAPSGGVGVRGMEDGFVVKGHDPAGDSIRFHIDWGDSSYATTSFDSSPCSTVVAHVYTSTGTFTAVADAEDIHGLCSQPESISVIVGTAGGVIWYWLGPTTASPLVINDIVVGAALSGHPAFCEQTQHIIVGSSEGGLSALNLDLSIAWQWPDSVGVEWGAPAINGDKIYIGHLDDRLFYFIDSIDHGVRVATFTPHASFVDAPVIDAQGNVYFGTDSGHLYKVGPELDTVFWRTRLLANGAIHSPIIGGDGTIYCASDFSRVYAIDPASGTPLWTTTLDGDPFWLALGQSALFVASSFGKVYSINPATGTVSWDRQLSQSDGFYTTPVVAANGYVYFQSDADVLYCVNQADGTVIWPCNCPNYLPRSGGGNSRRPGKVGLNDYAPNPTILSNGNIIVLGSDVLYCVAGYPEGPLDPLAPWPKWQHDLYNTGYVGGGK